MTTIFGGFDGDASVDKAFKFDAKIENKNGFDFLKLTLQPDAKVITNQKSFAYMDGGIKIESTVSTEGSTWLDTASSFLSGQSVFKNQVSNPTKKSLKYVLSPTLQGAIVQLTVKYGESYRFRNGSFMACTPNLAVSGTNEAKITNFDGTQSVGGAYVILRNSDKEKKDGHVWISSTGAIEKHEVILGNADSTPLYMVEGCFLGMMTGLLSGNEKEGTFDDYWSDYVTEGTANEGWFSNMGTGIGYLIQIKDKVTPPKRKGPVKVTVYTQSLSPIGLNDRIRKISSQQVQNNNTQQASKPAEIGFSWGKKGGMDSATEKYLKYKAKYLALKK